MTARRRWIPIVAGVAILLVFVGIGAVAVSMSWMREHLEVADSTDTDAAQAFDEVHAKFVGRAPMLELRDGKPSYPEGGGGASGGGARGEGGASWSGGASAAGGAGGERSATKLTTLHVLAWNPEDGRLARFELPFWMLRLKSTPIQFGTYASGLDETGVRLRTEDIERHGPGVILDFELDQGERVLLWAD